MKFINREEVCSACLEYQLQPLEISDECIKDVYKCFTNDYKVKLILLLFCYNCIEINKIILNSFQNDKGLYLCYYCKHTFSKISSFKSMCTQSYLFLTKNLHCSKVKLKLYLFCQINQNIVLFPV